MARGTLFLRYIIIGFYAYTWYEHLKVLDQPGMPDEINFHKLWFRDNVSVFEDPHCGSHSRSLRPVDPSCKSKCKSKTNPRCMVDIGGF